MALFPFYIYMIGQNKMSPQVTFNKVLECRSSQGGVYLSSKVKEHFLREFKIRKKFNQFYLKNKKGVWVSLTFWT